MAQFQNLGDLLAFVGDDWDPIPFQLTPAADITGWQITLSVLNPTTGAAIFSETAVMSGPGTNITAGLCYFNCPAADTAKLGPLATSITGPKNFPYTIEATINGGKTRLTVGSIPVRR